MKSKSTCATTRAYRQEARAAASDESRRRIVEAFLKRAEVEWFERITLESVAQDCGVTIQTVIRKFGGKEGLLEAACQHLGEAVQVRRSVASSDIEHAVQALAIDYEHSGRLVMHLLDQESRHPMLKPTLDKGRRGHREWLAEVFADKLGVWPASKRRERLDALVVATDLYVWKLVRIDMGRSISAFKKIVSRQVAAALAGDSSSPHD